MRKFLSVLLTVVCCLYSCKEDETVANPMEQEEIIPACELFMSSMINSHFGGYDFGLVTSDSIYYLVKKDKSEESFSVYLGQKCGKELPLIVDVDSLGVIRSVFCDDVHYDFKYGSEVFDLIVSSTDDTKTISAISYKIFGDAAETTDTIAAWAKMAEWLVAVANVPEVASSSNGLSAKKMLLANMSDMSGDTYTRRQPIAANLIMSIKDNVLKEASIRCSAENAHRKTEWFGNASVTTLGAEWLSDTQSKLECRIDGFNKMPHADRMGVKLVMKMKEVSPYFYETQELAGDDVILSEKEISGDGIYSFDVDAALGIKYVFQPHLYRTWTESSVNVKTMTFANLFTQNETNPNGAENVECQSSLSVYGENKTFEPHKTDLDSISLSLAYYYGDSVRFYFEAYGKAYSSIENVGFYMLKDGKYIHNKGRVNYRNGSTNEIRFYNKSMSLRVSKKDLDNIDYDNYIATKKVQIGTYVCRNGEFTYSEPQECVLTYNRKPSVNIVDLSVGETVDIDEGNWDRQIFYNYRVELNGGLFMKKVYRIENVQELNSSLSSTYDTTYSFKGDWWWKFSSQATPHVSVADYVAVLDNDKTILSDNRMRFSFDGKDCEITLCDYMTRAGMRRMVWDATPTVTKSIAVSGGNMAPMASFPLEYE